MTCERCSDPLFILSVLYPDQDCVHLQNWLEQRLADFSRPQPADAALDQRDAFLITYGDQFTHPEHTPLRALRVFAEKYIQGSFTGLHVLPFYPYSSDDGFAVTNPYQVDPRLGTWEDIEQLAERFKLACDLVLNHVSSRSPWFQGYLNGDPRYQEYFIEVAPETDLSEVVRPRTNPLLTPFKSSSGTKWLWTTFSADQVDLNYGNPAVLQELIELMLRYVQRGARVLRLDAVAYLGKQLGTPCIHLPQAHLVVRLLRAILDRAAPDVRLLTETNVSHEGNVSYFGNGYNEAHMVYNFALPPLVLHAFAAGQVFRLKQWAAALQLPSTETLYFNFLASHDGIGLNPAGGILSADEIDLLVSRTLQHGGRYSSKANPDGSSSPYELNISYFDALSDPQDGEPMRCKVARFLSAHAILLAMAGLPGVYVHSLLGTQNWIQGVYQTGQNRAINRQKLTLAEVEQALADPQSRTAQVYQGLTRLLRARAASAAFHPYGAQLVLESGDAVFGLMRIAPDGSRIALCLHNVTSGQQAVSLDLNQMGLPGGQWQDLITGQRFILESQAHLALPGYAALWLVPFPNNA